MTKLKTGPTEGLTPKASTDVEKLRDRLATDFYLTFSSDHGAAVLDFLRRDMDRPPQPGIVNPDTHAWFYNGGRDILSKINKLVERGEKIASAANTARR